MIRELLEKNDTIRRAPPARASPDSQPLTPRILQRDGWRCQWCGRRTELQVHHLTRRSQQGDDAAANLITLCSRCHATAHR